MKIIKKRYSLVEICICIVIFPIVIGLISSMYVHVYKVSKATIYNSGNYSNINQSINQINIDASSSYNIKIEDKKITFYNSSGPIQYSYEESKKGLYRNDKFYANLTDFKIKDISTEDNLYPLYELTFYSDTQNTNRIPYPFEISTKITVPIKLVGGDTIE